jgi:signal peptidase I
LASLFFVAKQDIVVYILDSLRLKVCFYDVKNPPGRFMSAPAQSRTFTGPRLFFIGGHVCQFSWPWILRQCWVLIILASLGTLSYLLITRCIIQSIQVQGSSMYPTLTDSGRYWLNRFSYIVGEPQQSDIVALRDPRDNTLEVKRIIAMPGQSVYLKDGRVYVNGKLLKEPYLLAKTHTYAYEKHTDEFTCVGSDKFFVMGDNRNDSTDSRTFGAVPRRNIIGKVIE